MMICGAASQGDARLPHMMFSIAVDEVITRLIAKGKIAAYGDRTGAPRSASLKNDNYSRAFR
jgi:hypothetical protein